MPLDKQVFASLILTTVAVRTSPNQSDVPNKLVFDVTGLV